MNFLNFFCFAQDPYLHRPLPFLIGSEQFFQTDNLGLGNLLVGECHSVLDPPSDMIHYNTRPNINLDCLKVVLVIHFFSYI